MRNWWLAASSWQCASSGIMSCAEILDKKSPRLHSPPALVPCNLWLFPKLKTPLKGTRFQTVDKIQENMMGQLEVIPTQDFAECFKQWKRLWENCVRFQGAHFEGDWGVIVLCTVFPVSCIFFNNSLFFLIHTWTLSGQTIYAYIIHVYTHVYMCGDCKYRYMQTHIYTHDHMYYTGVYTHSCVCMCITSSTASPAYVPVWVWARSSLSLTLHHLAYSSVRWGY